jgi:hypothetical protein
MTERPYADMVVFEEDGLWYVRIVMKPFGPCSSKRDAIAAAIETARRAECDGETARVLEQNGLANFKVHWLKPAKPPRRRR